jgi:hypothetical protein
MRQRGRRSKCNEEYTKVSPRAGSVGQTRSLQWEPKLLPGDDVKSGYSPEEYELRGLAGLCNKRFLLQATTPHGSVFAAVKYERQGRELCVLLKHLRQRR